MKTWTKLAAVASVSMALGAVGMRTFAQDASQTKSAPDVDKGMGDAAKDHAAQKKALAQEYKDKRQALTQSADWKTLSPAERKAKLKALQQEFTAKEKQLNADYKAEVQAFAKGKKAGDPDKGSDERSERSRSSFGREQGGMHGDMGGHGRR